MTARNFFATRLAYLLAAAGLVALATPALAEPVSNLKLLPIKTFDGTINSIPIPFGDTILDTGLITLSLDTTATNVFGLDDVLREGYIDVTLLMTSPLLELLGDTPRIRIVEQGPAWAYFINQPSQGAASQGIAESDCNCNCLPFDFVFFAALTGGGTVQNGIFEGTVFQNVNAYQGEGMLGSWLVRPDSTVTWDINDTATITLPDGTRISGIGGTGTLTVVPEPASCLLAGLGLAAVVVAGRRGRRN